MLGFAVVTAAIFGAGHAAARALYRRFARETPPGIELFVTSAVLGVVLWLAAHWVLAITFTLSRRNVLLLAAAFAIAAVTGIRRPPRIRMSAWVILCALPIAAWTAFILWRGYVVPPVNHDLLAYHLPKAVMMMKAGGLDDFPVPDPRLRTFPANYELLLADVLLLSGNDRLIEWISVATYLLFLAVTAMYARRWWGPGPHVAASALAVGASSVLLIHSGHAKNDLLTGALAATAVYWSARWCVHRGALPAILAILCGVTAVGTKMTAGAIAIAIAPFGLAALVRRPPRLRAFAGAVAFALVALLLCGGWVFIVNATESDPQGHRTAAGVPTARYGDWALLWELPFVILRVSLGLGSDIPWTGKHWPWLPYDLFGPHFGPLVAVCMLAAPVCIWRFRREGEDDLRRERLIATVAALVAVAILLPIVNSPRSAAQAVVRYALFVLPVVIGWTIPPLTRLGSRFAPAVLLVLIGNFALQGTMTAIDDEHAPLAYARWCAANPATRRVHTPPVRAASVADQLAGPRDKIVVGGGDDTWIYPAYGAALAREVEVLRDPRRIPRDAQWITIDEIPHRPSRATPSELRLFELIRQNREFVLVYRDERFNQSVFRRRQLTARSAAPPATAARAGSGKAAARGNASRAE